MNDIGLDREVLLNEFRRESIVGDNASDLGGSEKDVLRFLAFEESLRRRTVNQIEFSVGCSPLTPKPCISER